MSTKKTTKTPAAGRRVERLVRRWLELVQRPACGSSLGEMVEDQYGDYCEYEEAITKIEKLLDAITTLLIGCAGVGVQNKTQRQVLQECVNAAIKAKREVLGGVYE